MRFFFPFLLLFALSQTLFAQGEILSTVRVIAPQLQRTDKKVFEQLEVSLREWINNNKWTGETFAPDERIKVSFILTVNTENEGNSFSGELTIQAVRPVYGSGYDTPVFSHQDRDITFSYEQNQPLEFLPNVAENPNLTTIFAYYTYIILGLDYDTFSLYGGEPHYLTAQQIVNNAQNTGLANLGGWKPTGGDKNRSRFWFMENVLSPRLRPYRTALYNYHRKGMDLMASNAEQARAGILSALEDLDKSGVAYINSMAVQLFIKAKVDELVEVWKLGTRPQKERVIQIINRLDPATSIRFREIGL
jgi:Domain of unknown function (DUF4835)